MIKSRKSGFGRSYDTTVPVMMIVAIVLIAFAESVPATFAADPQAGKLVYDKSCKGCHGAKGEGNPAIAAVMGVKFRHLASKEVQAKTDEQLANNAAKGTEKRPKRSMSLSDQQVLDAVAFVRTLILK